MTYRELQQALADGTLRFCPPPLDAYYEPQFVEKFARDVFDLDWQYCGVTGESRLSDLVDDNETDAVLQRIAELYGVSCADVPELNFWLCLKRCEYAAAQSNAEITSSVDRPDRSVGD